MGGWSAAWALGLLGACAATDPATCGPNRWPGSGAELAASGTPFALGARLPELETSDQFGDPFCASQLRGRAVVLGFVVTWTTPAQALGSQVDDAVAGRADVSQGIVLAQDEDGEAPDAEDVAAYAVGFGISGPVFADPDGRYGAAIDDGVFPAFYIVDRDQVVVREVSTLTCAGVAEAVSEWLDEGPLLCRD